MLTYVDFMLNSCRKSIAKSLIINSYVNYVKKEIEMGLKKNNNNIKIYIENRAGSNLYIFNMGDWIKKGS